MRHLIDIITGRARNSWKRRGCHIVYLQDLKEGTKTKLGIYEHPNSARYNQEGLRRRFGEDENLVVVMKRVKLTVAVRIFEEARAERESISG